MSPIRLSTILFSIVAASGAVADPIRWRSGDVELPVMSAAELHSALADNDLPRAPGAAGRHVVVQFSQPVDDGLRASLGADGLTLLSSLGSNAFFASLSSVDVDALARTATLTAVEPLHAGWKLHPTFLNGETPEWAVVGTDAAGGPIIGAYVVFHGDVSVDGAVHTMLAGYGAIVRDDLWTINALVIELPLGNVPALAEEDAVQWIEPPLPRLVECNDSNRVITQANTVQAGPYNLTGTGVTVLVYDGGTALSTHQDFGGRLFVRDSSGLGAHPTHVSGTIGGSGVASGGTYKGMAPGVIIQSYGFQYDGSGTFLYTNPGDMQSDYNQAINTHGADIANNSIGTNTETNGFACSIQGDYGVTDQLIDNMVRGSLGAPFRIVFANGNERQGNRCDVEGFGDYYSTAPPATAKNHLTVGALNSNDDSMTSFSSWGPTDDGRMKPDISAPGCQSGGDGGVTSCNSSGTTSYTVMCGTSMASPTVCGLSALLLEDFRAQFPGSPDFRNSTLRILWAHTAQDRGNTGPDYQFGYGSVRAQTAVDFMRTGNFGEFSVGHGATYEFTINVAPATPQLKLTMAWDDYPGTPNVIPSLINDLDLEVFDPSSNQQFPWTLNPANPSAAAVQTARNTRDNIEQVLVNSPASGVWTVVVRGLNVPQGPQTFSIAATGGTLTPEPSLQINLPNGVPAALEPGVDETVSVQIVPINDTVVGGSPTLHVRYDGGSYLAIPLTSLGGNNYEATLPPPTCAATPEFYFSAVGTTSGLTTNPSGAPGSVYTAVVESTTVIASDAAESDPGWTVGAPGDTATTGIWNRMDPEATIAQPGDDHTPAGVACWVTDGVYGGSDGARDVDNGATSLTTPAYDLSAYPEAHISYWRWYSNSAGGAPNADIFRVQISNNNGTSFSAVETIGPAGAGTSGGWLNHSFRVADLIAPTAQVKLRFIAEDAATGSLIEAAVDDLEITQTGCTAVLDDCNGNGIVDSDDIASGRSADVNGNDVPDECEPPPCVPCDANCDGSINGFDVDPFVDLLTGGGVPCSPCAGDTNADGSVNGFDIDGLVNALTGGGC
ncbi:MAG: hypothetical protein CHACPFDD_01514 [Phycisphaerae bacterium]|nr:hypothetical protein [Phycisphaerae bacterium]